MATTGRSPLPNMWTWGEDIALGQVRLATSSLSDLVIAGFADGDVIISARDSGGQAPGRNDIYTMTLRGFDLADGSHTGTTAIWDRPEGGSVPAFTFLAGSTIQDDDGSIVIVRQHVAAIAGGFPRLETVIDRLDAPGGTVTHLSTPVPFQGNAQSRGSVVTLGNGASFYMTIDLLGSLQGTRLDDNWQPKGGPVQWGSYLDDAPVQPDGSYQWATGDSFIPIDSVTDLRGFMVGSDGTLRSETLRVGPAVATGRTIDSGVLERVNGGFVWLWMDVGADDAGFVRETAVHLQRLDNSLRIVGPTETLYDSGRIGDADLHSTPQAFDVLRLDSGHLVMMWQYVGAFVTVFDPRGHQIGETQGMPLSDAGLFQVWTDLEQAPDGQIWALGTTFDSGAGSDYQVRSVDLAFDLKASRRADLLLGTAADDRLSGRAGNDRLQGLDGPDLLSGSAGDDQIIAGRGPDRLSGGSGKDLLAGGAGDDVLSGGAGRDVFVFDNRAAGNDRIVQFNNGLDKVDFMDQSMGDLHLSDRDDGLLIRHDGGSVLLVGTTLAQFGVEDLL